MNREGEQEVPHLHLITQPCLETVCLRPAWAQAPSRGSYAAWTPNTSRGDSI